MLVMSLYLGEMSQLPEIHPEINLDFSVKGRFITIINISIILFDHQ